MGGKSMELFTKKPKVNKLLLSAIIIFLVVMAGILSVIFFYPDMVLSKIPHKMLAYMPKPVKDFYQAQLMPLDSFDSSDKIITIKKGWSARRIADYLKEQQIIKNSNAFLLFTDSLSKDSILKAGDYRLSPSMTAEEVLGILSEGRIYIDSIRVTIPEGFELRQIKQKLVLMGLAQEKALEDALSKRYDFWFLEHMDGQNYSLEGYLFPDTYEFEKGITEEEIVSTMLKRFSQIFNEGYKNKAVELGMNIGEVVTLASIVEREAVWDSERPIISGVFHNRLKTNMLLQSCATVQYVIGERKPILTYKDIEVDSPYNTYKYQGLPPKPIASPGRLSLDAALNPQNTEFLYFVAKKDGSHTFSRTYEEHLRASKNNLR